MGVFLDDTDPRSSPAPAQRNYTKAKKRDFGTHRPKLKQVFYIGDGKRDNGNYQKFVPPTGATRLYLGIMDERGRWSDNSGSISVEVGYPVDAVPNGVLPPSTTTCLVK